MEVNRFIEPLLLEKIQPGKVLVLLGARRVGKTALLNRIVEQLKEPVVFLNGDDIQTHNLLDIRSTENYLRLMGGSKLLVIDEAQEITDIGKKLKLIADTIPGLRIIISGSSAFQINNQVAEPLVGRMRTVQLYPLAQLEFSATESLVETTAKLEERLILGGYPELIHLKTQKEKNDYLKELAGAYLLKDVFAYEGIKKRDKIIALLQKIAFRCGTEISLESLGRELQLSKNTVEKYLDLFTKVFIIYPVSGFSRNLDNEITKMKKWYFMDNGIRNALINNFNPLNARDDTGLLWENYLNAERIKKTAYQEMERTGFFWRTHAQQEIDRIETYQDNIDAFEYKWGAGSISAPSAFKKAYPNARFQLVNKDNYLNYIT